MKPSVLALIGAVVLSVVAAVAIAGVPAGSSDSIVIDAPATTAPTTVLPTPAVPTPTPATSPATSLADAGGPETTVVPPNGPSTTDADRPPTTDAVPEAAPRGDVAVAVANAANRGGLASRTAARLRELGYVDVRTADSVTLVPVVAYFADGFELEAVRLLEDLEVGNGTVAPLADAPSVNPAPGDVAILFVLGTESPNIP